MIDDNFEKEYDTCKEELHMFLFEIHAPPTPQKQTVLGRNRRCYDPSHMSKKFIQWQVQPHAPKELLTGAIEMHLTFYMPVPKFTSGRIRSAMLSNQAKHVKRPDVDNLAYLVTNALKGIVYVDDSQICRMTLEKLYGETPKTVIKIIEV